MSQTLHQTLQLEDCIRMINTSKNVSNRRKCSIKISQTEYFKDRHPKVYLQTFGVKEVEKELIKMGYHVSYEKQDKQVSVGYDCLGNIKKMVERDLKTTNLVITW